jgi:LuxR family transcriptional regulator, maltose regulon positive regulatory protein
LVVVPLVPHAKITVPQLPPEFVVRSGLRASLEASSAADVTLVCAPAGYGKTLLLADWTHTSTSSDTAWVGLDRDDNDPRRLWAAIVASLDACPSVQRSSRLQIPRVWHVGALPEFLAELVDAYEAVTRPIKLVLDDLHELVAPEAMHGLEILIRNHPAGIQLVLSSRCDPPLSLPRLRLAGRLRELRAAQLRFSLAETTELLERSSLHLTPTQVELLHRRTGGWAAGLRLAALGVAGSADRNGFLAQFSGDERTVADYLVGEVLAGLPEDVQEFLRVISISEPIPGGLAAVLSGRQDAGSVLDTLEHETALLTPTGPQRDSYCIQELLRTHLLADLRRHGPKWAAELHGAAACWWADQHDPTRALDHAVLSHESGLLTELLHRFGVSLILSGQHAPLRRALACAGAHAVATDPWLALISALVHLEAGELPTAQDDMHHAQQSWPTDGDVGLAVLRAVAEKLSAGRSAPAASSPVVSDMEIGELPPEPELEALARLGRASARRDQGDLVGAGAELELALVLSRRHGFDYLAMQCLALQGVIAGVTGDVRAMRTVSGQAVAAAAEHGWECSLWSATGMAMLGYAALMRTETAEAERLAADGLALGVASSSPQLQFALRAIHGAAVFDGGERTSGLTELQQARSKLGDLGAGPEQVAAMAMLEFRAALMLGHVTAARTALGWLAERTGDTGELHVMRGWAEACSGSPEHARAAVRPVLQETTSALLPQTMVDAWLLETSVTLAAGERAAARRALQAALAVAERLDVLRPFAQAGTGIRELLVYQQGSFGAAEAFAERALAAGARHRTPHAALSERELTVLRLLPSLLSLGEIAADLTVSVNTVKSHVRSIYAKLGVSSRRLAVLAAHEQGLLTNVQMR